ncbi:AAA family ATPase, partial [Patescibacteria group bacterium]|nr:AAA family ATPase [Patescibacteria group bacterium]
MSNFSENPFKSPIEAPSVGEVLKDPIGLYLKRQKSEEAAQPKTAYGLDAVSAEHRAEILGGAYRELQEAEKSAKKGTEKKPADARKLAFVSALYSDPSTQAAYLEYWQKYKGERREVNGTYEEYRGLDKNIKRLEKEYDELSRILFAHRGERASEMDKALFQHLKSELESKRAELDGILEQYPKLAARVSYDRMAEYNKELSDESYVWFPSRRDILEQIEDGARSGRPVLLLGESGTGKTSLVTAAAKKLTGLSPFKNQGGPSTRLQDSLATKGLIGDESCLVYQPLGQAITGKENSLDKQPLHQGGIAFDDEFNNRPRDIQMEIVKSISNVRPGKKTRLPLIGETEVRPNYLFVAAGNPPSDRYDREPVDPAVEREFGTPITVDYPEQSLSNPEIYEGMLASLMDKNHRIRFAKQELEPPAQKDALGKETGKIVPGKRKERVFLSDPKAGGIVWRFA